MSAVIPPAIRYLGSKFLCAEWIISHFPPHRAYCEPCGGSAAVLLNKPRAELETYNDIDGGIVNFFRVVRDNAPELTRRLNLSPWSREEFDGAQERAGLHVRGGFSVASAGVRGIERGQGDGDCLRLSRTVVRGDV